MNYNRISELYALLDEEHKLIPLDQKRIDEINHYLGVELSGKPPKPPVGTFWTYLYKFFPLPENWKTYVTATIGAFIALNTQLHLVPQNVQDALLAVAVSLGFWAVNATQTLHYNKMKRSLMAVKH